MNRTKFTLKRRREFLEWLQQTGNVTQASQAIGISRRRMYELRDKDEEFARDWAEAEEIGCDMLEAEARRRAMEGIEKPVFYRGEQCGVIREYSDTLLVRLLQAHRPEKFRERHEVTGKDGAALRVEYIIPGEDAK